jgi:hypothetical protein
MLYNFEKCKLRLLTPAQVQARRYLTTTNVNDMLDLNEDHQWEKQQQY